MVDTAHRLLYPRSLLAPLSLEPEPMKKSKAKAAEDPGALCAPHTGEHREAPGGSGTKDDEEESTGRALGETKPKLFILVFNQDGVGVMYRHAH